MAKPSLTPNSKAAAAKNSAKLTAALCDTIPQTVVLDPGKTYYVEGPILTNPVVSQGRIKSDGSFGYSIDPHPSFDGSRSRLVQTNTGPLFRISGAGFVVDDPVEFVGDGVSPLFQIEGRLYPATGRHRFRNCLFRNAGSAFDCLAGYYDGTTFVDCEQHADNSIVDGCEFMDIACAFRSRNQQAVNWVFRDPMFGQLGKFRPMMVADIIRGGLVTFDRPKFCTNQVTLARLKDYSPNNCKIIFRDIEWDRNDDPATYLCPVEYVGDAQAAAWSKWIIEVNGFACMKLKIENKVPANLPQDLWNINIQTIYK